MTPQLVGYALALLAVLAVIAVGLVRAPRVPAGWATALIALLVVAFGAGVGAYYFGRGVPAGSAWRGVLYVSLATLVVLLYLFLGVIAIALVNGVWLLIERSTSGPSSARPGFVRIATVVVTVGAVVATCFGAQSARHPKPTSFEVTSAALPAAFDGYRIALISDIHFAAAIEPAFLDDLVAEVNAQKPDLIVIAGDIADGRAAVLGPELAAALTRLAAPDGVAITTGNHEYDFGEIDNWMAFYQELSAAGTTIRLLNNTGFTITRAGASIEVLGVNDRTGTPPFEEDLQLALDRLTAGGAGDPDRYRVLVAHQPRQADSDDDLAARSGVDLQLSGHTHGGQVWPFRYFVPLEEPVVEGMHEVSGITVVTSRGAGAWGPPVRIGADPEIPIITLRSAA